MIYEYSHKQKDISGRWDSEGGQLNFWFPHKPVPEHLWNTRMQTLIREISKYALGPTVELCTPIEEPDQPEDNYGLVVVDALYVSDTPETLFDRINLSAAAALYCPIPSPDELFRYNAINTLNTTGTIIEKVCYSSLRDSEKN